MKESVLNYIEVSIITSPGFTEDSVVELFKTLPHLMLHGRPQFDTGDIKMIRKVIGFFYVHPAGSYVFNIIKGLICAKDEMDRYIPIHVFESIEGLRYLSEVCTVLKIEIRIITNEGVCFVHLSNKNRI